MDDDIVHPPPSPPPPPPPSIPITSPNPQQWPWIIPPGLSEAEQNQMLVDPPSHFSEPSLNRFHEHGHRNLTSYDNLSPKNFGSRSYDGERLRFNPDPQLKRSFLPEVSALPSIGAAFPELSGLDRHQPAIPQYKSASDSMISNYIPSFQHQLTSPKSHLHNSNNENPKGLSSTTKQISPVTTISSSSSSSSSSPSLNHSQKFSGLPTITSLFGVDQNDLNMHMGSTTSLPAKYPSTPSFPAISSSSTQPRLSPTFQNRPQSLSDAIISRQFNSSNTTDNNNNNNNNTIISSPSSSLGKDDPHSTISQGIQQPRSLYFQYYLVINPPAEELWYADRHYPPITVELIESSTNKVATQVNGWGITVSLLDGFGQNVSDLLTGRALSDNHNFTISHGRSAIGGIRFSKVSSKNGGFFQLVITPTFPELVKTMVAPCCSGKIQVLSYRLYHAPKVPLNKLRGTDPVARMKGIGSLYAQRLSALGIERVEQLAQIDIEGMGTEECQKLVENLRKDRGAMTPTKLMQYIVQAREIVEREQIPE